MTIDDDEVRSRHLGPKEPHQIKHRTAEFHRTSKRWICDAFRVCSFLVFLVMQFDTGRVVWMGQCDGCCKNCATQNQNVFAPAWNCFHGERWNRSYHLWLHTDGMEHLSSVIIFVIVAFVLLWYWIESEIRLRYWFFIKLSPQTTSFSCVWRSAAEYGDSFFFYHGINTRFLASYKFYTTTTAITRLHVIVWRIIIDRVSGICFVPQATKTTWSRLYYALFLREQTG